MLPMLNREASERHACAHGAAGWRPGVMVSVLVALCLCAACEKQSGAERFRQQRILLIGNNAEPQSLDPHMATAVADGKIISALLEGLVRPDAKDDTIVHPGMAESWEHNDDASVWVFHLRDTCWSDGHPVTAYDFTYAYQRLLHPEFGGKYAEMLYPLLNAEAYNRGECPWSDVGVDAPDAHTLRLRFNGSMPQLLPLLLHYTWFPVPRHNVEASGGMLDRRGLWTTISHWVGNGAYVRGSHRMNDHLEVLPNPRYWRAGEVRNRGIRFLPIVNGYTETRMYLGGKLHITNNVPPELVKHVCRVAADAFCRDDYYCTVFYRLNTTRWPLTDARVRRAFSLAVDRTALVEKVVRGVGKPAFSFTPPGAGYQLSPPEEAGWGKNEREQEARRLLAQAGFPGGKGFPVLELMTTTRDVQKVTAETIQTMWEETLGVHVEIRPCEWTAYKAAQQNGDYDISSSTWSGDYLDPATFIQLWSSGNGNNCTGWGSETCDAALSAAARCGSESERLDNLQKAEREMLRAHPVIPLYWSERTYLKSPVVSGWHPLLLDNHPLDAVELGHDAHD